MLDSSLVAELPLDIRVGQAIAVDKSIDHFADNDRGILWMCCGSGKTVACAVTIELRNEPITVVFTPYIHLVKQWRDSYLEWLPTTQAKFLCVCSENDSPSEDDFRHEAKLLSAAETLPAEEFAELVEEAKRSKGQTTVSTNPEEIATFLKQPGRKVVFCTYTSAPIYGEGQRKAGTSANFGIFDEAHLTASGGQSNMYTHALYDENIEIAQRLFTTATVRHYTREELEFSMDNESVYGGHILIDEEGNPDPWTIRKAIEHYEVAPYRIVLSFVADPKFSPDLAKYSPYKEILADIGARAKPEQVLRLVSHVFALERAKEKYGIKKPLGFLRNVTSANLYADVLNVCKKYPEYFPHLAQSDKAVAISSYDPASKRRRLMDHLRNSSETEIANARLFIFGADEKSIDAVYFNDPMSSPESVVQASGRAQRYVDGKIATIIVPVMLPTPSDQLTIDAQQMTPETIKGAFRPAIDTLDRLADMDPVLRRQMTHGLSGSGRGPASNVIELDFPPELFGELKDQFEVAVWREINPETDFIDKINFDAAALDTYRLQQYPLKADIAEEAAVAEQRVKIKIIPERSKGFESSANRMARLRRGIAAYFMAGNKENNYGSIILTEDRVQLVLEKFGWDSEFVLRDDFLETLKEDTSNLEAYRLQQYPYKADPVEEAVAIEQRNKIKTIPERSKGFEGTGRRMGALRRGMAAYLKSDQKEARHAGFMMSTTRVQQVLEIYGWDRDYVLQDEFAGTLKGDVQALEAYRLKQFPVGRDEIEEAIAAEQRSKIRIIPQQAVGLKTIAKRMGGLRRGIAEYLKENEKEGVYKNYLITAQRVQQVFEIYGWDHDYVLRDDLLEALKDDVKVLNAYRLEQYPLGANDVEEAIAAEERIKIRAIPTGRANRSTEFSTSGTRMGWLRRSIANYFMADGKEGKYGQAILTADRVQKILEIYGWDREFVLNGPNGNMLRRGRPRKTKTEPKP